METHTGRPSAHDSAVNAGVIDDIPDLDGAGDVDHVTTGVGKVSLSSAEPAETPDLDDIPDMEEELEEGDDEATAAPPKPSREATDAAYVVIMGSFPLLDHRSCVAAS